MESFDRLPSAHAFMTASVKTILSETSTYSISRTVVELVCPCLSLTGLATLALVSELAQDSPCRCRPLGARSCDCAEGLRSHIPVLTLVVGSVHAAFFFLHTSTLPLMFNFDANRREVFETRGDCMSALLSVLGLFLVF